MAHLQKVYAAAERGPSRISYKDLVYLAGRVYRLWVERFEENPGTPEQWAAFKAFNRAVAEGRISSAPPIEVNGTAPQELEAAKALFGTDLTEGINVLPRGEPQAGLEGRFGKLATWVLVSEGLEIDAPTRQALLAQVASAATDAAYRLKRNASGDYTPDPKAARFPASRKQAGITITELFERWQAESKPAASTVSTWKGVIRSLREHLKHDDLARVAKQDVVAWKDHLVSQGLSPKTINDSYLAGIKALLNYGVANKLVETNPAKDVRAAARKRAGERKLPYEDQEVARLLALAERESHSARRWLPWLAALSGARIGELAQLWGAA
jgi:hypothetical protein